MSLHSALPVANIPTSRLLCIVIIIGASLKHFQVVANTSYSNSNDSKSIPQTTSTTSSAVTAGRQDKANLNSTSSPLKILMVYSEQASKTLHDGVHNASRPHSSKSHTNDGKKMSYDVASWLPKEKKSLPGDKVNLTILPALALLVFLIAVCLKVCSWFRNSIREEDIDSGYIENYFIIKNGDEEYMDVDFRSDTSILYDTVSSYTSFQCSASNYNTWNSVRSVQVVHPTDIQALYKAFLLQRKENQPAESVNSYKAFVKQSSALKDMQVQVELLNAKEENTKPNNKLLCTTGKSKKNGSKLPLLKVTCSKATETENGFIPSWSRGNILKKTRTLSASAEDESVGLSNINSRKSMKDSISNSDECSSNKSHKKVHRFKVSFVTDGSGNVVSSSQPNLSTVTANISPNHSPSSILSNSNIWTKTSENQHIT